MVGVLLEHAAKYNIPDMVCISSQARTEHVSLQKTPGLDFA